MNAKRIGFWTLILVLAFALTFALIMAQDFVPGVYEIVAVDKETEIPVFVDADFSALVQNYELVVGKTIEVHENDSEVAEIHYLETKNGITTVKKGYIPAANVGVRLFDLDGNAVSTPEAITEATEAAEATIEPIEEATQAPVVEETEEPVLVDFKPEAACWQHEQWDADASYYTVTNAVDLRGQPGVNAGVDMGQVPAGANFMAVGTMNVNNVAYRLGRWWNDTNMNMGWIDSNAAVLVGATASMPDHSEPTIEGTGDQVDIQRVRVNNDYVLDAMAFGDVFIVEGRQDNTPRHHVWSLVARNGAFNDHDTWYGFFCFMQGSGWKYDRTWNADELGNPEEPALAAKLANDKRVNMQNNVSDQYDWPIDMHAHTGAITTLEVGEFDQDAVESAAASDCAFEEPRRLDQEISGTFDGAIYIDASIGANNCRVIVIGQLDGDENIDIESWIGSRDDMSFAWILGYMIPDDWTNQQIMAYAPTIFSDADATGTIDNNTPNFSVPGMPAQIVIPAGG